MHLFQYAIIWTPTEKQVEDGGAKPKLLVGITTTFAKDINAANIIAARAIPADVPADEMDQIQLAVRPF